MLIVITVINICKEAALWLHMHHPAGITVIVSNAPVFSWRLLYVTFSH